MNKEFQNLIDAYHFASCAHRFQRRKNNGSTYMVHLTEVAQLLKDSGVTDVDIIIAGILHDVLEDTPVTIEMVKDKFGDNVARYVLEVSDDKSLPKGLRKKKQVEKLKTASYGAKMIKMADKYSNLSDLIEDPPKGWTNFDIQNYFVWSREVVLDHLYLSEHFTIIFSKLFSEKLNDGSSVIPENSDEILEKYYSV